jgi:peroxiredoxin
LRRWEELRPELDALGVRIVTLCTDTPAQIRAGRAKHGARAVMLSDDTLAVTDLYGLRNPKNFAPAAKGGPPTFRPLPIPTTLLVDARGIVRWIDQSADYQVRSDPSRVREALRALH